MATIVTRYINAASVGGDGTTTALSGASSAYSTIASWQTAEAKNLVSANEIHKIVFCGGALFNNTLVNDANWVTDIDHFLWFTVNPADRFYGVLKSGFYIYSSARYDRALYVTPQWSVFEYLDVEEYPTGWRDSSFGASAIVFGCHYSDFTHTMGSDTAVLSSLFTGGSSLGLAWYYSDSFILNCTIHSSLNYGFLSSRYGTKGEAFNCVSVGAVIDDFGTPYGAWTPNTNYNASGDLTAPGTNSITSIALSAFTDAATQDYSISGTTSPLYAAGSTLAALEVKLALKDRTQYTIPRLDIAGNPLPTVLDIGAFAFQGGGPSGIVGPLINSAITDSLINRGLIS